MIGRYDTVGFRLVGAAKVTAPAVSAVGQFLTGVGLLLRGLGMYARTPRLVLLGILPALITGALFLAGYATLVYFVTDLVELVTPFADDWAGWARDLFRVLAGFAFLALGAVLGVLTFTAITLVVGDPFYEEISARVETRYGGVPGEIEVSWLRSLRRSMVDSLRLVSRSVLLGVPLFFAGFIPVLGQFVVPVVAAAVGGWFLVLELVGAPFYRRGLRLADRRRVLKEHRPVALGFGVAVFCCFLIPLGAILVMPAAVAGAALLARRSLGQSIEEPGRWTEPPKTGTEA